MTQELQHTHRLVGMLLQEMKLQVVMDLATPAAQLQEEGEVARFGYLTVSRIAPHSRTGVRRQCLARVQLLFQLIYSENPIE